MRRNGKPAFRSLFGALFATFLAVEAAWCEVPLTRVSIGSVAYAIPTALIDGGALFEGPIERSVALLLMWPGLDAPPPPGVVLHANGVVAVYLQEIPPVLDASEAGFLRLWRPSTRETFALSPGTLVDLHPGPPVDGLGLLLLRPDGRAALTSGRMQSRPDGITFYADAALPSARTVMTCDAETSCALWWRQDDAAAEAIFDVRYRDSWATVKAKAETLFDRFRVRP